MLLAAVEAGVMFEAHMACPEDPLEQHTISNIASFLIAAGRENFIDFIDQACWCYQL